MQCNKILPYLSSVDAPHNKTATVVQNKWHFVGMVANGVQVI